MTKHKIGTRKDWLAARLELLKAEKEHTRRSDELAKQRQALPWVRVDKAYRFDTDAGTATLADLFQGRSQLLVYHFMFGPDYKAGCPSCSSIADGFNGFAVHLANHDVTLIGGVARAAREAAGVQAAPGLDVSLGVLVRRRIQLRLQRLGHRGAAAHGRRRIQLRAQHATRSDREGAAGTRQADSRPAAESTRPRSLRDRPGMSTFAMEDGVIYHTYSTYARGLDGLWGMYQWLDRAPLGRNEQGIWWKRHDEYATR